MKKPVLLAALALLVAASMLTLKEPESLNYEASAQSFLEDVRVVNQRTGKLQWSFTTDRAVISEDGATATMQAVAIDIPGQGMTVVADSGVYDIDTMEVALSGNIKALTEDYVIRTDSVRLRTEEGVLSTEDRVVLEGSGFKIEGSGLRADERQKVRLLGDVNAVFF